MTWWTKCRLFLWRHPEWWTVAISGLAWAEMLWEGLRNAGHAAHHRMSFAQEIPYWMLMVAAMMLPLVLEPVRVAAVDSLWKRRHRAMAEFLAGYLAPWLVFGLLAAGMRQGAWAHTYAAAALGFAAAAVWQRTPLRERALTACCGRLPLAPVGWRADLDCLRYGANIGAACVGTCWPLMLACAFTGHSPIAMAGGMIVGTSERWHYRPRTRTMLAVTVALALYYVALAGWGPGVAIASPQAGGPEVVGSTAAPFSLQKGATQVWLSMHAPTDPALMHEGPQRRVFLNIEKIMSPEDTGPFDVYLNLPPNEKPDLHSPLYAGPLPMFGLAEASRAEGKREAQGLYEQLEITGLFTRLAAMPGWDPKRLAVTFVPRYPANVRVQVSRVTLSMARR